MLNEDSVFIPGEMNFFTAPVGTEAPTPQSLLANESTALSGWENLGHTKLDQPFRVTNEGGETSTKGSLQNAALRNNVTDRITAVEIDVMQMDKANLKRYFGANSVEKNGYVYSQSKPKPVQEAILGVARDGDSIFCIHAYKADVVGNGDIAAESTEDFVTAPLKFAALKHEAAPGVFGVSPVVQATTPPPSGD